MTSVGIGGPVVALLELNQGAMVSVLERAKHIVVPQFVGGARRHEMRAIEARQHDRAARRIEHRCREARDELIVTPRAPHGA